MAWSTAFTSSGEATAEEQSVQVLRPEVARMLRQVCFLASQLSLELLQYSGFLWAPLVRPRRTETVHGLERGESLDECVPTC